MIEDEVADEQVTVLLPAGELPDGAVVTKRNGQTRYLVRRTIEIHGSECKTIAAGNGAVFLWTDSSPLRITAIPDTTQVLWTTSLRELHDLLYERYPHP